MKKWTTPSAQKPSGNGEQHVICRSKRTPIVEEFKIWQHKMETILERPGPEQVTWELFMDDVSPSDAVYIIHVHSKTVH